MRASSYARLRLCDEATERELLGCLIVDVDLRRRARRILRADDFYLYHHRLIYHVVQCSGLTEFFRIGEALAWHPLIAEVGGADYVRDLAVHVENYAAGLDLARHIARLGQQRRILKLAEDVARAAVNGHIDDISKRMNRKLKSALRASPSLEGVGQQMQLPGMLPSPVLPDATHGPNAPYDEY